MTIITSPVYQIIIGAEQLSGKVLTDQLHLMLKHALIAGEDVEGLKRAIWEGLDGLYCPSEEQVIDFIRFFVTVRCPVFIAIYFKLENPGIWDLLEKTGGDQDKFRQVLQEESLEISERYLKNLLKAYLIERMAREEFLEHHKHES